MARGGSAGVLDLDAPVDAFRRTTKAHAGLRRAVVPIEFETDEDVCRRCGIGLEGLDAWPDADGRRFCGSCFARLRREPDGPGAPRFRCTVCGQTLPANAVVPVEGKMTCADCRAGRAPKPAAEAEPPDDTPAATAMVGDAAGTVAGARPASAEELEQIVARLEGKFPTNLHRKITCPHCWNVFATDQVLWVSQHAALIGDPVLGPEAAARFRPSRFSPLGEAFDARGMACTLLACPRCHLTIPRALAETEPLFFSIIGAPASGKSHFLATMTWQLRRQLPQYFGVTLNDADTVSNLALNGYEETLFLQPDANRLVAIRKTELQGELYDQVQFGQQIVSLPRPFLFTLRPAQQAAAPAGPDVMGRFRVLCLYDNAGEHFQPGMDTTTSPGTQHMAKSRVLMFLYDPTQHPRFREECRSVSKDPQLFNAARTQRQETVLTEAANRVRRYTGAAAQKKHDRPLIVVVSKADIWSPLLGASMVREPLLFSSDGLRWAGSSSTADAAAAAAAAATITGAARVAVDLGRIQKVSAALRELLIKLAPEFVVAAEDFCSHVLYVPVSALGCGPEIQEGTGMLGVRPKDIKPMWVTAPILYAFAAWSSGMIPGKVVNDSGV